MILAWLAIGLIVLFGFVVAFGAPYVPSLRKEVSEAFDTLYRLGPSDVVVDLGSGDGTVLKEAAKRGAKSYGYELNPILVLISKLRLGGRAKIQLADMWSVTLPESTTLVYAFSVSRDSKKLGRYVQTQVDTRGRSVHVLMFGAGLEEYTPVASRRGYNLYEIVPKGAMHR